MDVTTNIYFHGKFSHSEKLITLKEYVQYGRLAPGQRLLIGEVDFEKRTTSNTKQIIIGDATPFHAPHPTDAGIGWYDYEHENLYVIEIHNF